MTDSKINIVFMILIGVLINKGLCFYNEVSKFDNFIENSKNKWKIFCNKSQFDIEFNTMQNNSYNELRNCIGNVPVSSLIKIYNTKIINPEDAEPCCETLDSYQMCLNNFTASIDFCNDGKQIKAFQLIKKFESIICKDKGQPLKGIIVNSRDCIKNKLYIFECLWDETELVNKIMLMSDYFFPTRDSFDSKDCSQLEKLEICVTDKLDQCPDEMTTYSPKNTAKEIFKMIKNLTACEMKNDYEIFSM